MRIRRLSLAVALAAASAWSFAARADPSTDESQSGARLYRVYCANCHGERGRGDGPTAELLKVAPADLTQFARANGGAFPQERVYRAIDGREDVRGHGVREMPIWGLAFQQWDSDASQEREIRAKIQRLVDYLKTLQID